MCSAHASTYPQPLHCRAPHGCPGCVPKCRRWARVPLSAATLGPWRRPCFISSRWSCSCATIACVQGPTNDGAHIRVCGAVSCRRGRPSPPCYRTSHTHEVASSLQPTTSTKEYTVSVMVRHAAHLNYISPFISVSPYMYFPFLSPPRRAGICFIFEFPAGEAEGGARSTDDGGVGRSAGLARSRSPEGGSLPHFPRKWNWK